MTEALARCLDVTRVYGVGAGAVTAVHSVSCEVAAGELVAVTGPSGSGKSTLLHLMAGIDSPTMGRVDWPGLGGAPRELPAGTVGMVFQGPSLLPALDATENVALPLLLAGVEDAVAMSRARDALDELDLGDLATSLPDELSGGQAQRIGLARALVGRPRLIVADEPTGQLDHLTAAGVLDVLVGTATRLGAALLVSTHDAAIAARLSTRWILRDGRLAIQPSETEPQPC